MTGEGARNRHRSATAWSPAIQPAVVVGTCPDLGAQRTEKALLRSVLAAAGFLDEVPFGHHPPVWGARGGV